MEMLYPPLLLVGSNLFMTYAWYGHLKDNKASALWIVILISWGVAFFEYCLQVPANRLGAKVYSLGQLKVMQEVITMVVFAGFAVFVLGEKLRLDYLWAGLCLVGATFFMFRGGRGTRSARRTRGCSRSWCATSSRKRPSRRGPSTRRCWRRGSGFSRGDGGGADSTKCRMST